MKSRNTITGGRHKKASLQKLQFICNKQTDCMPSVNAFSVKFFLYAVVYFPVFVCKNPKPGFDIVQTWNLGLEKDVRVYNPYSAAKLQGNDSHYA